MPMLYITTDKLYMDLYVANEQYDGDIIATAAYTTHRLISMTRCRSQIKHANDVIVNYSLTAYSPFEG